MADIQLRFNKDVLVLSEPVMAGLKRQGLNVQRDGELTLLLEPEVFEEAYRLDALTGVQCMVTPTAAITPARLARCGMEKRASELAQTALRVVRSQNPQHLLVEIGPCGLPLDAASKASLNENCDQYKRAAKLFEDGRNAAPGADVESAGFDAFFLNGFKRVADLKCALIGIRKVSDAPIIASVDVDEDGFMKNGEPVAAAVQTMEEYGAQVAGFCTQAPIENAVQIVDDVRSAAILPILVQLSVQPRRLEQDLEVLGLANYDIGIEETVTDGPYADAESMVDAAEALRAAGVQFMRAAGDATPAYTGALVAATEDLDVVLPEDMRVETRTERNESLDDIAARLREKVNSAVC